MIAEIASHREELRGICRRFHVRRLDLFGSAVREVSIRRAAISISWSSSIPSRQRRCRSRPFSPSRSRSRRCSAVASTSSSRARSAIPISRQASSARASPSLRRDPKSLLWDARAATTAIAFMTAGRTSRISMRSRPALRGGAPIRDSRRGARSTRSPGPDDRSRPRVAGRARRCADVARLLEDLLAEQE